MSVYTRSGCHGWYVSANGFSAVTNPTKVAYAPPVAPASSISPQAARTLRKIDEVLRSTEKAIQELRPHAISVPPAANQPAYRTPAPRPEPQPQKKPALPRPSGRYPVFTTTKGLWEVIEPLDTLNGAQNHGLHLVRRVKNGRLYVRKQLPILNVRDTIRARSVAEMHVLKDLTYKSLDDNIIFLLEAFWDQNSPHMSLILEYCDAGTIEEDIVRHRDIKLLVPEAYVWHVLASLTKALCMIHEGWSVCSVGSAVDPEWDAMCHLDIKPSNIFLSNLHKKNDNRFPPRRARRLRLRHHSP